MPYFGGKQRIADQIVALLPPHRHYVEPFAGGLSVFLAKPVSDLETLNDLDQDIVTFWRMLRDRPDDLARVCVLSPHSRVEKDLAFQSCDDPLEQARRVWVRLTQARSSSARQTGWRAFAAVETASHQFMADNIGSYLGRLLPCAERLKRAQIECLPALDVIERYGTSASTLFYADPPYVTATRTDAVAYAQEMTDEDHRGLARALRGTRALCAVSGYDTGLYDQLYDGWWKTRIKASSGNAREGSRDRVEVLWTNYDPTQGMHLF
jgi:DNA adenine methylase